MLVFFSFFFLLFIVPFIFDRLKTNSKTTPIKIIYFAQIQ